MQTYKELSILVTASTSYMIKNKFPTVGYMNILIRNFPGVI
jgi:hypothetical protein